MGPSYLDSFDFNLSISPHLVNTLLRNRSWRRAGEEYIRF
jgi:hypothetical protein